VVYHRKVQEVELVHSAEPAHTPITIMRGANLSVEERWDPNTGETNLPEPNQAAEKTQLFPNATNHKAIHAMVVVEAGELKGAEFMLPPNSELIIGRSKDVDISLRDNHLSRQHAKIVFTKNDGIWIFDLKSLNGTVVNDDPIDQQRRLQKDDIIKLGNNTFRVTC